MAIVTLNSPHNRNALSTALVDQLLAAVRAASRDEAVRVVVLSHTGPVFSAGADLTETAAAIAAGELPIARLGEALLALAECPKPGPDATPPGSRARPCAAHRRPQPR